MKGGRGPPPPGPPKPPTGPPRPSIGRVRHRSPPAAEGRSKRVGSAVERAACAQASCAARKAQIERSPTESVGMFGGPDDHEELSFSSIKMLAMLPGALAQQRSSHQALARLVAAGALRAYAAEAGELVRARRARSWAWVRRDGPCAPAGPADPRALPFPCCAGRRGHRRWPRGLRRGHQGRAAGPQDGVHRGPWRARRYLPERGLYPLQGARSRWHLLARACRARARAPSRPRATPRTKRTSAATRRWRVSRVRAWVLGEVGITPRAADQTR